MAHARCFSVNSQQTAVIKQLMEAFHSFLSLFFFSFSPDHKAVVLSVPQRDLHKAKLLIASLQGARLDNASHPFFQGKKGKKKKTREILETAAKRISAYA